MCIRDRKYTASPGWRSGRPRGFHRCLSWGPLLFPLCGLLQRIIRTRLFYHKTGRETIPFPPPCGCAILKKTPVRRILSMEIRTAAPQDLPAVTRLEALCFPPAEAAPKAAFRDRLAACPQTCWLLWDCLLYTSTAGTAAGAPRRRACRWAAPGAGWERGTVPSSGRRRSSPPGSLPPRRCCG